jgi:hypothetical protein
MNAYFVATQELFNYGKKKESEICLEILAWIAIHTDQLSSDRSEGMENYLNEELQEKYRNIKENFLANPDNFPETNCNPWKDWLGSPRI